LPIIKRDKDIMAYFASICKRINKAATNRELSWTQAQLLKYIIKLSQGRLGGCIARIRYLAKAIGRSIRHTRRLIAELEQKGWLERHSRYLPETRGQISNLIHLKDAPLPEIRWQDTRPNNYATHSDLTTAISLDSIKATLEYILSLYDHGKHKKAKRMLTELYMSIKRHDTFMRFFRYFQQKRSAGGKIIQCQDAYIFKCIKNFGKGIQDFWEEFLEYLQKLSEEQPTTETCESKEMTISGATIPQPDWEQNLLNSISDTLPLALRERMLSFYKKRFF